MYLEIYIYIDISRYISRYIYLDIYLYILVLLVYNRLIGFLSHAMSICLFPNAEI